MPHQFQAINCKKCSHHYCPVCERICPKCGEYDITDEDTMITRSAMRLHMDKKERAEQTRIALAYKISYMKYNVNKNEFPRVMSLPPEIVVELTDKIGEEHPKMDIKDILYFLEKNLSINKSKEQRPPAPRHTEAEILAELKRLNDPKNPGWEAERKFRELTRRK